MSELNLSISPPFLITPSTPLSAYYSISFNPFLYLPLCIILQGSIGAGKSTLLRMIQNDPELSQFVEIIEEPLEYWIDLLKTYYRENKIMAPSLQSIVMCAHTLNQQKVFMNYLMQRSDKILLFERDLSSCYMFVECLQIDPEYATAIHRIGDLLQSLSQSLYPVPKNCSIYLKTSAEKCFSRIQSRSREGENFITVDYLKLLEEAHERHFDKIEEGKKIIIDNSEDNQLERVKAQLREFLLTKRQEILEKRELNQHILSSQSQ